MWRDAVDCGEVDSINQPLCEVMIRRNLGMGMDDVAALRSDCGFLLGLTLTGCRTI